MGPGLPQARTLSAGCRRNLDLKPFAGRYAVREDPRLKLAGRPEKLRDAVARRKVVLD